MLKRLLLVVLFIALVLVALEGFQPSIEWYFSMRFQKVDGKPYLVLESDLSDPDGDTFFSVYRPSGSDFNEWQTVTKDRRGPLYGTFALKTPPPAAGAPPEPEKLGIFFDRRASIFDVNQKPAGVAYETLPFAWPAETAIEFQGSVYAFGVMPKADHEKDKYEGVLKAARYDGQKWEELKADGPLVTYAKDQPGFSLQAVEYQGAIKIFWRTYEKDEGLGLDRERRFSNAGPLQIATFDGTAFSAQTASVQGLPRGNSTLWADADKLRLLIQTSSRLSEGVTKNGPMEIYEIDPVIGAGKLLETIPNSDEKSGLISFIGADHVSWQGQEFILRSNWQMFEVWNKPSAESPWKMVLRNPKGLPVYDMERTLMSVLGICLAIITFGAGLAWQRRKHAYALMHKIRANELYASLSLRVGAYIIDLTLVSIVAVLIARMQGLPMTAALQLPTGSIQVPHWPTVAVYMIYFCGTEWLFGTTLGKYIMGLCVVMDNGRKLSFWAAFVRNFVGLIERNPTFIFVIVPFIIFGPRRQRIGDLLGRTFVVQKAALEMYEKQREEAKAAAGPALPERFPAIRFEMPPPPKKDKEGRK